VAFITVLNARIQMKIRYFFLLLIINYLLNELVPDSCQEVAKVRPIMKNHVFFGNEIQH
jgi:hypothetical protein